MRQRRRQHGWEDNARGEREGQRGEGWRWEGHLLFNTLLIDNICKYIYIYMSAAIDLIEALYGGIRRYVALNGARWANMAIYPFG